MKSNKLVDVLDPSRKTRNEVISKLKKLILVIGPTNEEDWDKEMDEVESMYYKARDAYEAAERDAASAAFSDDEEEAEYLSDRAQKALEEYEKYEKVRDAYEEKGQELGVYVETITFNGKRYKPIRESKKKPNPRIFKENYEKIFRSLK